MQHDTTEKQHHPPGGTLKAGALFDQLIEEARQIEYPAKRRLITSEPFFAFFRLRSGRCQDFNPAGCHKTATGHRHTIF